MQAKFLCAVYKHRTAVLRVCTPVFTDMRAAQILHARMDFLGCPYSIHPHGLLAYGRGVASHGFGLDLVVGVESGGFK
jgi:hypothetical protein